MNLRLPLLALAIAFVAVGKPVPKATPAPKPAAQIGAWSMVTDQVNANLATGDFSAPDHVTMTRADGSVINADRATGNYKTKQAQLYGNVSVHDQSGTFGLKSSKNVARGPATLTADELTMNDETHLYDATGHVHYVQAQSLVDADTAHLNDATHILVLTGHVHVVDGDRTLDSKSATYNTITGAGVASGDVVMQFPGGNVSIATPKPINIKGPKIP